VTVEHRDVVSTEKEVTELETRAVITNTAVKYIILFRVAVLVQKTWKQHIIMGLLPRKLARVVRPLNYTPEFFGSYTGRDTFYPEGGAVTSSVHPTGCKGQFFETGHDFILQHLVKFIIHEISFYSTSHIQRY
jgi:hypothetical protein